jgi:hypothetical protein
MVETRSSDRAMQPIWGRLLDLLAQWQGEILESREAPLRVKSPRSAQQTTRVRVTVLELLQREVPAQQAVVEVAMATLGRLQNAVEGGKSGIEAVFSPAQHDVGPAGDTQSP